MLLLNEEYFYNIYDHFGFKQQLWQAMTDLDHRTSDSGDDFVWKLCIPKAHARLETDVLPKLDDVEKVEHYEIYVFKQVGKANMVISLDDKAIKAGLKAGDLIKTAAPIFGGGGGGRPNMAQAGGKNPAGLKDAIAKVLQEVEEKQN